MSRVRGQAALRSGARAAGETRRIVARAAFGRIVRPSPVLLACVAGLIASIPLALLPRIDAVAASWASVVTRTIVVVPDPQLAGQLAGPAGETRVEAVRAALGGDARILSGAEVDALLAPWLGAGAPHDPVPGLILATSTPDEAAAARVAAAAPGSIISADGGMPGQSLARAAHLARIAARVLAALAGLVSVACLRRAVERATAPEAEAIPVLRALGATRARIATSGAARLALLGLAGGIAGTAAACPLPLLFGGTFRDAVTPALAAIPLAASLAGGTLGLLRMTRLAGRIA